MIYDLRKEKGRERRRGIEEVKKGKGKKVDPTDEKRRRRRKKSSSFFFLCLFSLARFYTLGYEIASERQEILQVNNSNLIQKGT